MRIANRKWRFLWLFYMQKILQRRNRNGKMQDPRLWLNCTYCGVIQFLFIINVFVMLFGCCWMVIGISAVSNNKVPYWKESMIIYIILSERLHFRGPKMPNECGQDNINGTKAKQWPGSPLCLSLSRLICLFSSFLF